MRNITGLLTLVLLASTMLHTARAEPAQPAPLFASHAVLPVRIEAPLDTIMRTRDEAEYRDGFFHYTDDAGATHTLDVKIRARGKYRRRDDVCRFAPLRLNFRKKQVDGTVLAGQDKLKLVTHCQPRTSYEQYVLKEYLAYRILQLLTDNSFSVRLLRAEWVDTGSPGDADERYAFLIEDDDLLGERLGTRVAEVPAASRESLDPSQAGLVAVFQYLIGNTDFSLSRGPRDSDCCHNAVLYEQADGKYLPIPYDFDFSGLVRTPYAEPNPELRIRNVTTRLYRGYCEANAEMPTTLQLFRDRRVAIRDLIITQEGLDRRTRSRALRFVDKFYDVINDPRRVERNILKRCL